MLRKKIFFCRNRKRNQNVTVVFPAVVFALRAIMEWALTHQRASTPCLQIPLKDGNNIVCK